MKAERGSQVIKTETHEIEVNCSFWIWHRKSGLANFKLKWQKYIKTIDTKWSIFNPLKIKVKALIVYENS